MFLFCSTQYTRWFIMCRETPIHTERVRDWEPIIAKAIFTVCYTYIQNHGMLFICNHVPHLSHPPFRSTCYEECARKCATHIHLHVHCAHPFYNIVCAHTKKPGKWLRKKGSLNGKKSETKSRKNVVKRWAIATIFIKCLKRTMAEKKLSELRKEFS